MPPYLLVSALFVSAVVTVVIDRQLRRASRPPDPHPQPPVPPAPHNPARW